ncbi:MAG TPA: threonine synthase [Acidimicrobiales bacterium]|nr:threonine synthase [Acidimicrobiales bacterium]
MKYVSTRGQAPALDFADVLLAGPAVDGGLYVPESWPSLPADWATPRPYPALAADVVWPYVEGAFGRADFDAMVDSAYATFAHPDVVPLVEVEPGLFLMELFHGPTLAFKDVALQLVGRMFDAELSRRGERATIVVATSGDTGSAAIAACAGRSTLDIVVLHPAGRVSEVQRRQMTTVDAPNVVNIAVEGTFDDCQDLVKALFADAGLRERLRLSAMNSINWARIAAQIPYYVAAVAALGPCRVAVPSGNFGNILAGWIARRGGAPIEQLIVGSNRNDILARWVTTGALVAETVEPTLSPSMDIQVSSNHERLLFELSGRDGAATAEWMTRFRQLGSVEVPVDPVFAAASIDDAATIAEMRDLHRRTGYLADPHTAVGVAAARAAGAYPGDLPVVCMATAHPAKFPDPVEAATATRPRLPDHLADILTLPERYDVLPADLEALKSFLAARLTPRE